METGFTIDSQTWQNMLGQMSGRAIQIAITQLDTEELEDQEIFISAPTEVVWDWLEVLDSWCRLQLSLKSWGWHEFEPPDDDDDDDGEPLPDLPEQESKEDLYHGLRIVA